MKTTKELDKLNNAIGKAITAYHKAIEDNLKECGKEVPVLTDDEDEKGLRLSVRGNDNDLNDQVVDKVRWNEEKECVEYHLIEFNYDDCDDWYPIYWLDDCKDYLYENIDWEDNEPQPNNDDLEDEEPQPKNKVWTITMHSVYDFEDNGVSTRVYADKNVAQADFDALRSSSREEDEKNEWLIDSDTDNYYESYQQGYYTQNHTLIRLEEHEI